MKTYTFTANEITTEDPEMRGVSGHWAAAVGAVCLSALISFPAPKAQAADGTEEACGPVASGKWGFLTNPNTLVVAGEARAVFCRGISLSFLGPLGTMGVAPDAIMPKQGAASFVADLTFIATNFIPEDEQIATPSGEFPFRMIPDLSKVSDDQTEIALRKSDGLANTVFFKLSDGRIAFFMVKKVEGHSFGDLLPLGPYSINQP